MSRKFSLAYLTIPGTAPVDQIRIAKEAGYDFVSLRTIPMHLPGEPEFLLHKDAKLFEETRQALKEYDMPVMDIELARVRPDLDINEYDPAFEKAAELGATDVLGSIWTRDKAYYIDQVAKIAEMAKKYGLKYNVEFLPWAGVRNLQEAITLVDTVRRTTCTSWWTPSMPAAPVSPVPSWPAPIPNTSTSSTCATAPPGPTETPSWTTSRTS